MAAIVEEHAGESRGHLGDLGSTLQVDRVLVATGRTPNTATLNLDATR